MGVFEQGRVAIAKLDQVIRVNGGLDARLWGTSISESSSCGGNTAEFSFPQARFDESREGLTDAKVMLWVLPAPGAAAAEAPDMVGYLDVDSGQVDPATDEFKLTAHSITAYLSAICVGDIFDLPVVTYKRSLKWTARKMLQDIFDNLPDGLKARLKLGSMAVLDPGVTDESPEVAFRSQTVAAAVDQLVALFGDIGIKERYDASGITWVEFYRIGDPGAPRAGAMLGEVGGSEGVSIPNIQSLSPTSSAREARTRVKYYGAPRKFVVSCKSFVDAEALAAYAETVELKRLIRDWDTTLEAAVKANPNITGTGSLGYKLQVIETATGADTEIQVRTGVTPWVGAKLIVQDGLEEMTVVSYAAGDDDTGALTVTRGTAAADLKKGQVLDWKMPGVQHVFKRYRLPECFRWMKCCKSLPILRENGEPYEAQVWVWPSVPRERQEGDADNLLQAYEWAEKPIRAQGVKFDLERGIFTLSQPALEAVKAERTEAGVAKMTYAETVVGITFGYEHPEKYLLADTGVDAGAGIGLDFAGGGLVEQLMKEELEWAQAGNAGYPIGLEGEDQDLEFTAMWFDEDTGELVEPEEAEVIKDEGPILRRMAREVAREKNRRPRSFPMTTQAFSRGYPMGANVVVEGAANWPTDLFHVTGVTHDLEGNSTTIQADNTKPPHRSKTSKKRVKEETVDKWGQAEDAEQQEMVDAAEERDSGDDGEDGGDDGADGADDAPESGAAAAGGGDGTDFEDRGGADSKSDFGYFEDEAGSMAADAYDAVEGWAQDLGGAGLL